MCGSMGLDVEGGWIDGWIDGWGLVREVRDGIGLGNLATVGFVAEGEGEGEGKTGSPMVLSVAVRL